MILYHFTPLHVVFGEDAMRPFGDEEQERDLPVTLTELTPSSSDYPDMPPVVWLTTDPNPGGPKEACCFVRVRLAIPSADRRLYPHKVFMRRFARTREPGISKAEIEERLHALPPQARVDHALRHWWVYEGTIPRNRWAGVEMVHDRQVWWGSLGGYWIGRGPAAAAGALAA